ncbi:MAG: PD40 domain-containing protein [Bacteroidales bacterium]|nr:PD40 domain-containing protein [Bacteroidales bacterium]
MKIHIIILFFCFLSNFGSISLYAQNKKYLDKTYENAEWSFKKGDFVHARKYIDMILEDDSSYFKAYRLLGEYFLTFEYYDSLLLYYKQCVKFCGKKYPETYFQLANYQFYIGNVNEALELYRLFLSKVPKSNLTSVVNDQIKRCEYAIEIMKTPVAFNPENLGDGINSECDEYYPYISPDEEIMVFTRKIPLWKNASPASDNTQEDFYISYYKDSIWTKAIPLQGNVNTRSNEGAQTITADGKYMVFTACNRSDGKGSCDLYYSEKTANGWSKAKNISEINTSAWESQPSISANGKELYFSSERIDGIGNSDIYVSYRRSDGSWGKPQILDTVINTPMAETSPFIHPDGNTLYFCSNGHWGVGGFDIFVSRRDQEGKWTKPVNLGYPINTTKNEIGLVVSASGKRAYITSSREGGFGLNDIYAFDLPSSVQPEEITYIKGKIVDKKTSKPLPARCEIIDLEKNKIVFSTQADTVLGEFLLCLQKGKEYGMFISSDGYLFHSENILFNQSQGALVKQIELLPIEVGASMVLPNVFFKTDSFQLKKNSYTELEKIVQFMMVNHHIKIEISGHTDNTGNDAYNQLLSEKRAQAVYNFLIAKGIPANRMKYVGYGSSKPLDTNDTTEGKALNRRTELKIIQ